MQYISLNYKISETKDLKLSFENRAFLFGDGFFEKRLRNNKIHPIEVTYTAGRRKKTENGFEAKKAKEILMY